MTTIHNILSNTWACVALVGIGAASLTVLMVTHTITPAQLKAAMPALLYGATVAWKRGMPARVTP
jgi:hypothetical protein